MSVAKVRLLSDADANRWLADNAISPEEAFSLTPTRDLYSFWFKCNLTWSYHNSFFDGLLKMGPQSALVFIQQSFLFSNPIEECLFRSFVRGATGDCSVLDDMHCVNLYFDEKATDACANIAAMVAGFNWDGAILRPGDPWRVRLHHHGYVHVLTKDDVIYREVKELLNGYSIGIEHEDTVN